MLNGSYTNVYTPCKVNSVDWLNRYHMPYIYQKCFAWSDSRTKNVPMSDWSHVVPPGLIFLPFCHNARVWQTERQTDRQTDRILITRPSPHSIQRGKNVPRPDRSRIVPTQNCTSTCSGTISNLLHLKLKCHCLLTKWCHCTVGAWVLFISTLTSEYNAFIIHYYSNRELTVNFVIFATTEPQFFHF